MIEAAEIPRTDLDQIRRRLVEQINAMSESELEIAKKSEASFALFVAEMFRSIAALLGYVIATPIAWGIKWAESAREGFADGWNEGFRCLE
jgi:hypothetical protein